MRTIPVFACLVIIVCVLVAPAWGQDQRRFSFGISPLFGMIYGHSEEIVYPFNTKAKYLSQLIWDMKPLFYAGARFDISYRNPALKWGLFSSLSAKLGIPGNTGTMEDSDWRSQISDMRTDYSIHDNMTAGMYWIDGAAGIFIPIQQRYRFRTFIDVSYFHVSFSARDGSGTYLINNDYKTEKFSGPVINYTQEWLVVAPAVSFEADFLERFSAGLSFAISPLIWGKDFDEHLVGNREYIDYMRWGLFLEPRGTLTFTPAKRFELSLEAAYRYITESRGESYLKLAGASDYSDGGEAGGGLSFLDTALFFKIRF